MNYKNAIQNDKFQCTGKWENVEWSKNCRQSARVLIMYNVGRHYFRVLKVNELQTNV